MPANKAPAEVKNGKGRRNQPTPPSRQADATERQAPAEPGAPAEAAAPVVPAATRSGKSGEGASSAMAHLIAQEKSRTDTPGTS